MQDELMVDETSLTERKPTQVLHVISIYQAWYKKQSLRSFSRPPKVQGHRTLAPS